MTDGMITTGAPRPQHRDMQKASARTGEWWDEEGDFEDAVSEDGLRGGGTATTTTATTSSSSASSTASTPHRSSSSSSSPRTAHLTSEALAALPLHTPEGLRRALRLVEDLANDDRLLQAEELWARVRAATVDGGGGDGDGEEEWAAAVAEMEGFVATRGAWLRRLEGRAAEARAAMADLEDVSC